MVTDCSLYSLLEFFSQAQSAPAVEKQKDELEEETLDPNVSASLLLFYFSRIVLLLSIFLSFLRDLMRLFI